jgi:hypothetical protein
MKKIDFSFLKDTFIRPRNEIFDNSKLMGIVHVVAIASILTFGLTLAIGNADPDLVAHIEIAEAGFAISSIALAAFYLNYRVKTRKACAIERLSKIFENSGIHLRGTPYESSKYYVNKKFYSIGFQLQLSKLLYFKISDEEMKKWILRENSEIQDAPSNDNYISLFSKDIEIL